MSEKIQWGSDNYTKMLKELFEHIDVLSKEKEEEIMKALEEGLPLDLFADEEKETKKNSTKKTVNSNATLDNSDPTVLMSSMILLSDRDLELLGADFEDEAFIEEDKFNEQIVKKIAQPFYKTFSKQIGKNLLQFGLEFISKGPGLTRFNIFNNVWNTIKQEISSNFLDKFKDIYYNDIKLNKSYEYVISKFGSIYKDNPIEDTLYEISNHIVDDEIYDDYTTTPDEAKLFKHVFNVVYMLCYGKYSRIILKELQKFYSNGNIIADMLMKLGSDIYKISRTYSAEEAMFQIAKLYMERYGDLKNAGPYKKYKPISSLFFMISSAIASIKSIKVDSETKVMIDENNPILTIGKYELDFNDLKTKKGTFEIYKQRKGVLNLLDYVEEYDRLGKLVLTNDDIKKIGRILDRLDHDVKEDLFGYNI